VAFEVLLFQHGELVGGHFAAVGAELPIELAARFEGLLLALLRARGSDHFLFQNGEVLLERFDVGVMLAGLGGELAERFGNLTVGGGECGGVAFDIGAQFVDGEGRGRLRPRTRGRSFQLVCVSLTLTVVEP
jgi:hypothetical protein